MVKIELKVKHFYKDHVERLYTSSSGCPLSVAAAEHFNLPFVNVSPTSVNHSENTAQEICYIIYGFYGYLEYARDMAETRLHLGEPEKVIRVIKLFKTN